MSTATTLRRAPQTGPSAPLQTPTTSRGQAAKPVVPAAIAAYVGSADSNQVQLTPRQQSARMLDRFTTTLGNPKTVAEFDAQMTQAVRATVGAAPSTPTDQVYNAFNARLKGLPADQKIAFAQAAFDASGYAPGEAKFQALAFFSKIFEIRELDGNIIPPQTKTAHQFGPGGVVGIEATPSTPKDLRTKQAIVRMAPGIRGGAPGFSFIFPGAAGKENQSRVLMSVTGDYSKTLSTSALGLKTEGPEGELKFQAGAALKKLSIKGADGKPSEAWMQEVGKLPAGTVLGTLTSSDPSNDWSITVKTGSSPLTTNMMADRSLRFPRNVRPKGVAGWVGWGAAAVVLSPLLAARAIWKAVRS